MLVYLSGPLRAKVWCVLKLDLSTMNISSIYIAMFLNIFYQFVLCLVYDKQLVD